MPMVGPATYSASSWPLVPAAGGTLLSLKLAPCFWAGGMEKQKVFLHTLSFVSAQGAYFWVASSVPRALKRHKVTLLG